MAKIVSMTGTREGIYGENSSPEAQMIKDARSPQKAFEFLDEYVKKHISEAAFSEAAELCALWGVYYPNPGMRPVYNLQTKIKDYHYRIDHGLFTPSERKKTQKQIRKMLKDILQSYERIIQSYGRRAS